MDLDSGYPPPLGERIAGFWQQAVRVATRMAIAFGLSVGAAILLGAAVTDNALAQIAVTGLAALGLWLPFFFLILGVERLFAPRSARRSKDAAAIVAGGGPAAQSWRRLAAVAPGEWQRIAVLQRSIERSRLALGKADLDPDAHDLCVLIDRRLPELIDRELDNLAPDDRNRRRQVGELVDLIEQFARHCSRRRSGQASIGRHDAEVLRRRFEAHLSDDPLAPRG
jgi:hypothetical protein